MIAFWTQGTPCSHLGSQGAPFSPLRLSTLPECSILKTREAAHRPRVQFPTQWRWPWLVACGVSVQEGQAAAEPAGLADGSWLVPPPTRHPASCGQEDRTAGS